MTFARNARHGTWCLAAAWLLAGSVSLAASADEKKPEARAPGDPPAATDNTFREQTIYIPYTKLRETFEREGRGVFLPYGQFEKLWQAAREKTGPSTPPAPPVPFLISEVENEATVGKDVVNVKAQVKIELLAEGWHHIPLGLADSALTRAMVGEQPARIVFDAHSGYQLLVEKKGKAAESLTFTLEYAKAYEKGAGRNSVSFQPPQAPVSRWRIHIPDAGVKVNITPLIAATQIPDKAAASQPSEETTVLAFVGPAPTLQIDWTPKAEGATGLTTLSTVQAEQQAQVEDGVVRTRTQLTYQISRAALSEVLIDVPADQRVVNVLDPNVRQWSVVSSPTSAPAAPAAAAAPAAGAAAEKRQRVAVQLFEPARESQKIVIELEKFVTEAEQRELRIPAVSAVGVGRQQGLLVVSVADGLRSEVASHTGLMQVDPAELPKSLTGGKWLLSYRYASLPYELKLQVTKVQPRVLADSLVEASLEPEQLTLDVLTIYTIERAGVFRFEYDVPAGYEVRKLSGLAIANAQPASVDTHYFDGTEKKHLVVNLAAKAMGRIALVIKLQRRLTEPDLLSPTGKSVELPLAIPRITAGTVERATGRLVVHAAERLRVNPGQARGLRSVSFKDAYEGLTSLREKSPSVRPVLAYTYAAEEVALPLVVERRKPQVTVRQMLLAEIGAGVIKYSATFTYDILYSGVSSLRIDLPASLAASVRNNTPGVREKTIDPPPKDLAAGDVAWSFAGETEFTGTVQIRLSWEKKIEELAVGRTVELALPQLRPRGVDRAWGQIVWTKAETIDVREAGEPKGVRPIDPQHDLMANASVTGAARAFEFHDDWKLAVAVTRYKLEEVKRTSIERGVLQMIATRNDQISVRAMYRMRTAGQRVALRLPSEVEFDNEPVRVNGRPVALERGDQQEFFVPLVGINADTPFLLELRYSLPKAGRRFVPPAFGSDPAVQKVYLCAYLPAESTWLGSIGPWTDEMEWDVRPLFSLWPTPRENPADLLNWVRQGLNLPANMADTFQTLGRPYVFAALHPSATGDGGLRLVTINNRWLDTIVLGAAVIIGALLLRSRAAARCVVAGLFLVALIASGVFLPTFSRQIVNDKLMAAVAVVLIAWVVQYVAWVRPRDPFVIARREARQRALLAKAAVIATVTPTPATVAAAPSPAEAKQDKPEGGEAHA